MIQVAKTESATQLENSSQHALLDGGQEDLSFTSLPDADAEASAELFAVNIMV